MSWAMSDQLHLKDQIYTDDQSELNGEWRAMSECGSGGNSEACCTHNASSYQLIGFGFAWITTIRVNNIRKKKMKLTEET